MKVCNIIAVGDERQKWDERSTNHWCLYLQTSKNTSVRLDMAPSYNVPSTTIAGGSKGILVVRELDYLYSHSATKDILIRSQEGLYVGHIVDALVDAKRDRYEFNSEGVGCRRWTTDSLSLLQQRRWGNSAEFEDAKKAITKVWPDGSNLPLDPGAYY